MDINDLRRELNAKQQKFVDEYALTGNATQSAINAGYSEKSADTTGSRMLRNDKVSAYLEALRKEMMTESILTGEEVLHHLSQIALGNTLETDYVINKRAEYIENENNPSKLQLVYNENTIKVEKPPKISDRNKALELLGKHHKLFTDKQEVAVTTPTFIENLPTKD